MNNMKLYLLYVLISVFKHCLTQDPSVAPLQEKQFESSDSTAIAFGSPASENSPAEISVPPQVPFNVNEQPQFPPNNNEASEFRDDNYHDEYDDDEDIVIGPSSPASGSRVLMSSSSDSASSPDDISAHLLASEPELFASIFDENFESPSTQIKPDDEGAFPVFPEGPSHESYFEIYTIPSDKLKATINETFATLYASTLKSVAHRCPPKAMFSSFNPEHATAVQELVGLYEGKTDIDSILQISLFLKSRSEVHPHLWYASFINAQQYHSHWLVNVDRPSAIDLFPTAFFPDQTLHVVPLHHTNSTRVAAVDRMYNNATSGQLYNKTVATNSTAGTSRKKRSGEDDEDAQCVVVDGNVGIDNGIENTLWYFREDVQLNAHHFLWHLLFPTSANRSIPRRGELFYFVHHDLLARYRAERMSNGMGPIDPLFIHENSVLREGYNAHLTDGVSSQPWVPRAPNTPLNSNTLNWFFLSRLRNLKMYRQRLETAFQTNSIIVNDQPSNLPERDNINLMGELMEASQISPNPNYYGLPGVHNDVHWITSNIISNYPSGSIGVMGNAAAAMRDPIFYRFHTFTENAFNIYKLNSLPPYQLTTGDHPLVFPAVTINSFIIESTTSDTPTNHLTTFWSYHNFYLEGGLDYNPNNKKRPPNINVCAKHLNHDEFTYIFTVNNTNNYPISAFTRIYMAPRFKRLSSNERFTMEEQRSMFFVMDSYVQHLNPGVNQVFRNSIDSTVTTPWPRSIQEVRRDVKAKREEKVNCECGFPHHLLIPRGHEEGMAFDVVIHMTDAAKDFLPPIQPASDCIPSHVHCGVLGHRYPDAKPMGYPFDRRPYSIHPIRHSSSPPVEAPNLETYAYNIPNMATTVVTITHKDIVQ